MKEKQVPPPFKENVEKLEEEPKDLIKSLLMFNSRERLTVAAAVNHPWFKGIKAIGVEKWNIREMKGMDS